MGISIFKGLASGCKVNAKEEKLPEGNPNPTNFSIKEAFDFKNACVVMVNYPDCENYEGNKILVFKGASLKKIIMLPSIDPHFCDDAHVSPFARFRPDKEGMKAAKKLASLL